jgi:ribosomal protein S18 acetylase RimI-like enzyme
MEDTHALTTGALAPAETRSAVALLARAFVADPLHEVTFGAGRLDRNEGFFRVALASMKGTKMAAFESGRMIGVAHWVVSPHCQYPLLEQAMTLPRMIRAVGLRPSVKVVVWLSAWSKHDPAEPHSHLGPIAVEPAAQGRGVGTRMMELYCAELDRTGVAGFLETDKRGNVRFYERFGFTITATVSILGVENWFMRRDARSRRT